MPDLMFVISEDLEFEEYQAPDPEQLFVPPATFVGKRVHAVLPKDTAALVADATHATLEDGERRTIQYSLDLSEGRRWFEAVSAKCDDRSVLFVVRDRTRQVLTEERLLMADRMASLGALASGIAHEINNPLTYVFGNLGFLRQRLDPQVAHEAHEALSDIEHGLSQVRALIRDLRVFSHPGKATHMAVDLDHVVVATMRLAESTLRGRARIAWKAGDVPPIAGNESQVGQVVLNLLTNAMHAVERSSAEDHRVVIETRGEGDRVLLEVSDTGAGLPKELGERIFEPFVTTKAVGAGTGLGLSVCRSIVSSFGGTIHARPGPERGTTFIVSFRRYDAPTTPHHDDDRGAPEAPEPRRARLLVVDDDVRVAQAVARTLDRHEVVIVIDGEAALREIHQSAPFDLVLCDLMMPGMTGMQLYRAVEHSAPTYAAKFVFMTGAAFSLDAREFVTSTARPLLQKPFAADGLRELVARQLFGPGD